MKTLILAIISIAFVAQAQAQNSCAALFIKGAKLQVRDYSVEGGYRYISADSYQLNIIRQLRALALGKAKRLHFTPIEYRAMKDMELDVGSRAANQLSALHWPKLQLTARPDQANLFLSMQKNHDRNADFLELGYVVEVKGSWVNTDKTISINLDRIEQDLGIPANSIVRVSKLFPSGSGDGNGMFWTYHYQIDPGLKPIQIKRLIERLDQETHVALQLTN